VIAQLVNKSAGADLRATKMLIDVLEDIEKKVRAAPPPETSRFVPAVSIEASIQLLGNFLEGVPRQQGHLGRRLSVLQFGDDADRPPTGHSTATTRRVCCV
jgi:hypothetical protein